MQRDLNLLLVKPNELPKKITIKNTLKEKQKLVGGLIEYVYLPNCNDVVLICNEEGKLLGLPPNRDIEYDIVCGDFLIVGDDPEIGEDRSLTDEQITKYSKMFDELSIEKTNERINDILLNKINSYDF